MRNLNLHYWVASPIESNSQLFAWCIFVGAIASILNLHYWVAIPMIDIIASVCFVVT